MKTIKHAIISTKRSQIILALSCVFLLLGCQERQVGSVKKSTAIEPLKTTTKSKSDGGEFRASSIAGNAFAITPTSGFKINVEYPWKMAALDTGVKVGEIKLDEGKATIGLEVPEGSAKKEIKVKGSFSVCNDEKCLIYRDEELTLKNP